jgi:hypothetical protein
MRPVSCSTGSLTILIDRETVAFIPLPSLDSPVATDTDWRPSAPVPPGDGRGAPGHRYGKPHEPISTPITTPPDDRVCTDVATTVVRASPPRLVAVSRSRDRGGRRERRRPPAAAALRTHCGVTRLGVEWSESAKLSRHHETALPSRTAPRLSRGLPLSASTEARGAYSPFAFSVPRPRTDCVKATVGYPPIVSSPIAATTTGTLTFKAYAINWQNATAPLGLEPHTQHCLRSGGGRFRIFCRCFVVAAGENERCSPTDCSRRRSRGRRFRCVGCLALRPRSDGVSSECNRRVLQ